MKQHSDGPARKKFNWKYFLFITVFLLICLEIFGRVYLAVVLKKSVHAKFRFNSYRVYEHIPGFHEGDGKKDWIIINNQGFRRTKDVTINKPAGTYRIFLLGGSAAHGISTAAPYPLVHIYMNQTIDFYLEKMLEKRHPGKKFEVINAAVTGYQVFQHTAYILSELIDYDPDLVIFMDGANDHYFNNPQHDYMGNNRYQFWKPRLQHASLKGWCTYGWLWLSKYSGFARGVYAWMLNSDASSYDEMPVRSYKEYSSDAECIAQHKITAKKDFLRSVESNISILQHEGIKSLVCLQPMLVLRDTVLLSQNEKNFLHKDENVRLLYPVVNGELDVLAKKYNVPYIDLNIDFNKKQYASKQLFVDYCHLSPAGGNVIALSMFPVVESIFATK